MHSTVYVLSYCIDLSVITSKRDSSIRSRVLVVENIHTTLLSQVSNRREVGFRNIRTITCVFWLLFNISVLKRILYVCLHVFCGVYGWIWGIAEIRCHDQT
jgi:hypothetical protein